RVDAITAPDADGTPAGDAPSAGRRAVGVPGTGPWTLRVGGYALAGTEPPEVSVSGATARAHRPDGLTSRVVGLRGLPVARVHRRSGANAYGPHSAVPVVESDAPVRAGEV